MNIIKTNLVLLRNFYQSQINTNITSIFMNNDDISSPLFKPFYLDFVNYIPFFIIKNILGIYNIDYLYETDGTIWNNTSDNMVKIAPLILSFELLDEDNNSILNLKQVTKDYSNDIKIDYIIKNEYLKLKNTINNYNFGIFYLFTISNNEKKLNDTENEYLLNLQKIIKNNNFKIKLSFIKNSIPKNEIIEYNNYKSYSKNQLLAEF